MYYFTDFIPENTAPQNAKEIGVYNSSGRRVFTFPLGNLAFPNNLGAKLYSFGALSDVHISQTTGETDFRRALRYFQDVENVDFVCIAGDLTQYNQVDEWELYKRCVDEESSIPVYAVGGNHDAYGDSGLSADTFRQYTGCELFYTFEHQNDLFIMMSQIAWASVGGAQPYYPAHMKQLYKILEANRNRRCFIFSHVFIWGRAGDPLEAYSSNHLWGTQGKAIEDLMAHYPNTLWFHGHSHQMFEMQSDHDKANYDFDSGCHNIHIPSCALPVKVDATTKERTQLTEGSQGYIVDVYSNAVVLRGRDFAAGEFLPIAIYCLDTTLKNVTANTFNDSTGTLK